MGEGVSGQLGAYSAQYSFVSTTKAYYFDNASLKAVIWNPQTMTTTGTIDLTALNIAGHRAQFSGSHPVRVGNELFYGVSFLLQDASGVAAKSVVVVVNVETDVATTIEDTRCNFARDGVLSSDGKIYWATETFASAARFLDETKAGPPCLIRLDPATHTFDDTFLVTLDALINPDTSGDIAGMLEPGATGTTARIRVLDQSTPPAGTTPIAVATGPQWKQWDLTLGDSPTATAVAGSAATNGRSVLQNVGDAIVVPDYFGTSASTALRIATGDNSAKTTVVGQVRAIARVR